MCCTLECASTRCGRAERAACRTERPASRREFHEVSLGNVNKAHSAGPVRTVSVQTTLSAVAYDAADFATPRPIATC